MAYEDHDQVKIEQVMSGGAASSAGVRAGDSIRKVSGRAIDGFASLRAALEGTRAGESVWVEVERGGETLRRPVVLASLPEGSEAPAPAAGTTASSASPGRVHLGVTLEEIIDQGKIYVIEVEEKSPASRAGLQVGDQFLGFDDRNMKNLDEVRRRLDEEQSGGRLTVTVLRKGKRLSFEITLGSK